MKRCSKCKEVKSLDDFNKDLSFKDGLNYCCRECSNAKLRQRYAEHSEHERNRQLKKNFGLTPEQFDSMVETQGGRCAICGTDEPGGKKTRFSIDHDHETGKVRGLLCNNCNVGIGRLKEDPFIFESAMVYLRSAA